MHRFPFFGPHIHMIITSNHIFIHLEHDNYLEIKEYLNAYKKFKMDRKDDKNKNQYRVLCRTWYSFFLFEDKDLKS